MQPAARRPCVLIICTEYILYEWLAGHLAENVGLIATSNFWLAAEVTEQLSGSGSSNLKLVMIDMPADEEVTSEMYAAVRRSYHGLIAGITRGHDSQRQLMDFGAGIVLELDRALVQNTVAALTRCSQAPVY